MVSKIALSLTHLCTCYALFILRVTNTAIYPEYVVTCKVNGAASKIVSLEIINRN